MKKTPGFGKPAFAIGLICVCCIGFTSPLHAEPEASLQVPEFKCQLKAVRRSGDATSEIRRHKKNKKRYVRCVNAYKEELAKQRDLLQSLASNISNEEEKRKAYLTIGLINKVLGAPAETGSREALSPGDSINIQSDERH